MPSPIINCELTVEMLQYLMASKHVTESPSAIALSSHPPESFFISNESPGYMGARFGKIPLLLTSRLKERLPLLPGQDFGTARRRRPFMPIVSSRASESRTSNPGTGSNPVDEDSWTTPTADASEEIISEADLVTPRRYTTDTLITYATSGSLAPSDIPLYTRMETSSVAASLSDKMSWRQSTETWANIRASTVSAERRADIDIISQATALSLPSQSREVYSWSAHPLILEPPVTIPEPPIAPSHSPLPRAMLSESDAERASLQAQIIGLRWQLSNAMKDTGRLRQDLVDKESALREKEIETSEANFRLLMLRGKKAIGASEANLHRSMLRHHLAEQDFKFASTRIAELEDKLVERTSLHEAAELELKQTLERLRGAEGQANMLSAQLDRVPSTQSLGVRAVEAEQKLEEMERRYKQMEQRMEEDFQLVVNYIK